MCCPVLERTHHTPDSFATPVPCMSLFRVQQSSQGLVLHLGPIHALKCVL